MKKSLYLFVILGMSFTCVHAQAWIDLRMPMDGDTGSFVLNLPSSALDTIPPGKIFLIDTKVIPVRELGIWSWVDADVEFLGNQVPFDDYDVYFYFTVHDGKQVYHPMWLYPNQRFFSIPSPDVSISIGYLCEIDPHGSNYARRLRLVFWLPNPNQSSSSVVGPYFISSGIDKGSQ
jgi:hypothetical protein